MATFRISLADPVDRMIAEVAAPLTMMVLWLSVKAVVPSDWTPSLCEPEV